MNVFLPICAVVLAAQTVAFCVFTMSQRAGSEKPCVPSNQATLKYLKEIVMPAIDSLTANVAENTTVERSAVVLLGNLKSLLDQAIAGQDWSQVQALSDQLGSNNTELANAVAANTPAAPSP